MNTYFYGSSLFSSLHFTKKKSQIRSIQISPNPSPGISLVKQFLRSKNESGLDHNSKSDVNNN